MTHKALKGPSNFVIFYFSATTYIYESAIQMSKNYADYVPGLLTCLQETQGRYPLRPLLLKRIAIGITARHDTIAHIGDSFSSGNQVRRGIKIRRSTVIWKGGKRSVARGFRVFARTKG